MMMVSKKIVQQKTGSCRQEFRHQFIIQFREKTKGLEEGW